MIGATGGARRFVGFFATAFFFPASLVLNAGRFALGLSAVFFDRLRCFASAANSFCACFARLAARLADLRAC
jgi:hypothetical protein